MGRRKDIFRADANLKEDAVFRTEAARSAVLAGSSVLAAETDLKDLKAARIDQKDRKDLMDRRGARGFKDPNVNFSAVRNLFRGAIEIN